MVPIRWWSIPRLKKVALPRDGRKLNWIVVSVLSLEGSNILFLVLDPLFIRRTWNCVLNDSTSSCFHDQCFTIKKAWFFSYLAIMWQKAGIVRSLDPCSKGSKFETIFRPKYHNVWGITRCSLIEWKVHAQSNETSWAEELCDCVVSPSACIIELINFYWINEKRGLKFFRALGSESYSYSIWVLSCG